LPTAARYGASSQIAQNAHCHGGSSKSFDTASGAIISATALVDQSEEVLQIMHSQPGKRPVFIAGYHKIYQNQRWIQNAKPTGVIRKSHRPSCFAVKLLRYTDICRNARQIEIVHEQFKPESGFFDALFPGETRIMKHFPFKTSGEETRVPSPALSCKHFKQFSSDNKDNVFESRTSSMDDLSRRAAPRLGIGSRLGFSTQFQQHFQTMSIVCWETYSEAADNHFR
jgi:hypothetical protein